MGAGLNEASGGWSLVKPYFCSLQKASMRKQKGEPESPRVLERRTEYTMI